MWNPLDIQPGCSLKFLQQDHSCPKVLKFPLWYTQAFTWFVSMVKTVEQKWQTLCLFTRLCSIFVSTLEIPCGNQINFPGKKLHLLFLFVRCFLGLVLCIHGCKYLIFPFYCELDFLEIFGDFFLPVSWFIKKLGNVILLSLWTQWNPFCLEVLLKFHLFFLILILPNYQCFSQNERFFCLIPWSIVKQKIDL